MPAGTEINPSPVGNSESYLSFDAVDVVGIDIVTIKDGEEFPTSILDMYTALVINENLFRNNIHGVVEEIDAVNLPSNLGLSGQEFLVVKFNTPQQEELSKVFIIDKMVPRGPGLNRQSQIYDLHFICPSSIFSLFANVNKAYQLPISEVVRDIHNTYFQDGNKKYSTLADKTNGLRLITVEQTAGNPNIIIPNRTPINAINWLASRAISKEDEYHVDYVWYQDLDGFHFRSVSSLFDKEPIAEYIFGVTDSTDVIREGPDKGIDVGETFKNIRELQINGYNITKEVRNGTYASNLLFHDIINKDWKFVAYNYFGDFKRKSHLNEHPHIKDDGMFGVALDSKSYFVPVHDSLYGPGFEKGDLNSGNDSVAFYLQRHNAYKQQIKANSIEFEVSGDSGRRVGDKVAILIHSFEGPDDAGNAKPDNVISGMYIITSIEHWIIKGKGHTMRLKCCKDSMLEPLPDYAGMAQGGVENILP